MNIFQRLLSKFRLVPGPQQIARQLRRPDGSLGRKVGEKMNQSNEALYDFTLDCMQLTDREAVLEIGFGNGNFFDKIFARAAGLQLSGIDFSREMVNEARKNNHTVIAANVLDLQFGSSDHLPFTDSSFDKVFCINVIYFWEQPEFHLREIFRVLKPGGKFYASIREKQVMEKMPFTQYGFKTYTEREWKEVLEKNNFILLEAQPVREPSFTITGQVLELSSLCLIAARQQ